MKLRLLCVGKLSEPWLKAGASEYQERIGRYLPLTLSELREEKGGGKKPDARYIQEQEGARILDRIPPGAFVIVLDEGGSPFTSEKVAGLLEHHMVQGTAELVMVIGGAYGLSAGVKKRADLLLSLSALTLTHQMARLFLLEQIYRGFTIVRNEPYHNR
ncbi:23S rRNA pseudoU1915 N3-methyltransferase RlmH [Desulfuromonas soudanensis]|uniref:Ribosomal RNA large subunit methyltransferase H n=1 Tax=Desulfuromonas soudanensis TaxID=1603606 RepID=A0A0M5IVB3_9BACT|nr:23S rRNA (pseudouridine(1915)-N(3))-methyltransferase RlmH [Desulfuromonas soudanensis]ALC15286.1 23S rRNA pseudoU1915 N3-methyltransferase RlmH [Desulfuromonas soudanensis]